MSLRLHTEYPARPHRTNGCGHAPRRGRVPSQVRPPQWNDPVRPTTGPLQFRATSSTAAATTTSMLVPKAYLSIRRTQSNLGYLAQTWPHCVPMSTPSEDVVQALANGDTDAFAIWRAVIVFLADITSRKRKGRRAGVIAEYRGNFQSLRSALRYNPPVPMSDALSLFSSLTAATGTAFRHIL